MLQLVQMGRMAQRFAIEPHRVAAVVAVFVRQQNGSGARHLYYCPSIFFARRDDFMPRKS